MVSRRPKQLSPIKKQDFLDRLYHARNTAIDIRREAFIGSAEYAAAGEITDAIDKVAEALTGDRTLYHLKSDAHLTFRPGELPAHVRQRRD